LTENDPLTEAIIRCALDVHRSPGPGLLESTYEAALCIEMARAGLTYERQVAIPATYKGASIGEYRVDVIVEDAVIVEVKSVERLQPVFAAQVLTYLRVTGRKVGLLINFNTDLLKAGIRRFVR
jgi:GxxExxY protein